MAVSLQPRVLYGLKTDITGNAQYITDSEILYPVGNVLVIHNINQQQQKFLYLPEKSKINIICISPNRKHFALCEVGERPTISIYDISTLKRRKSLGIPYDAPEVTQFNCIEFSYDNKYLAAITGEPDQTMLYYNWERGKMESNLKVGNPQNSSATVKVLSCNPSDAGVMAVGGHFTFKFLTLGDSVWRPYGFSKAENLLICSMTWLNADRLLAGTKDGRILYLENGDLKNVYKMDETISLQLKIREEYVMQSTGSQVTLDTSWENDVLSLISFPKGFAYGLGSGTVVLFEKEGQHQYTKRNIYVIPKQISKDDTSNLYKINTININISYDRLMVTTGWPQLFYVPLWGADLNMDPKPKKFKPLGQALHYGPIGDLSVCAWKPIFMTCGELDRTVRIWNFETESLVLLKQYEEDIYSIALHPMGLFCLVGFTDKLRFMTILIDDLLPLQEFSIRNCQIEAFSPSGHMFAAVNGNIIQVYKTIGFYNCFLMKGHTGRVKHIAWSQDDLKLVSIGAEGAIYEWNMTTGQRIGELILKNTVLHYVVLSSDISFMYIIANENQILEVKQHAITREFVLPNRTLNQFEINKNDSILFATCMGGTIVSFKSPLLDPLEFLNFHIHCTDITKIALSYSEQYLVSVAMDGSLCLWKLYFPDEKVMGIDKGLVYTKEVLVGRDDLEDKINKIKGLTVRLRELETEHTYKMRQLEIQNNDKMREVHQNYKEAIEVLKNQMVKFQEERTSELSNINTEILKMKADHEAAMKQMEINYDNKLITEYDKYQAFEEKNNIMRQNYEKRLVDLQNKSDDTLQKTIKKYEDLLYKQKLKLEETQEEMAQQARVQETLMGQIEDDADKEIVDLRTHYENLLYEEKQMNLRLKGETTVLRNRYMAGQRDVEELKRQVQRVQSEFTQFQKTIHQLEKNVADLKKEINERDITIQDKEKEIYELKQTNQELEKFKFVLNYKIRELKNQIEPRDQEIKELKAKINDMEAELVNLHKTNVSLELQLHELREKLGAARKEIQKEIQQNKKCQTILRKIRVDLLDTAALIQEPHALKAAVVSMYHKYSADEEFLRSRKADMEAQCDFMKQRDQLERTVASLKKQVFHDTSSGTKNLDKAMSDNMALITELNALREELRVAYKHITGMESLLGLTKKNVKPTEARRKLEKACHGYEELELEYRTEMQDCYNIITTLKDDIKRLLSKLSCKELEELKPSF